MELIRRDFLRRGLGALTAAAMTPVLTGAGQAPARRIMFSPEERAALAKIDDYFNTLKALKGGFVQIGPQGQVDRGEIYLMRPGRVRFEYQPPNPMLIVADGGSVAVANKRLKTVDTYPLSGSPLEMLLSDKVALRRSNAVLAVVIEPGLITIKARTGPNRTTANLSLTFAAPAIELRQWVVTDAQGGVTTVVLSGVERSADLPADLFVRPQKSDFSKPKAKE
jgi:outer membrane lipoprotein-sorting protein